MEKMPYKIQDSEGNIFVFGYYSSGYPVYRGVAGCKHIFKNELQYYKVLEQEHPQ